MNIFSDFLNCFGRAWHFAVFGYDNGRAVAVRDVM